MSDAQAIIDATRETAKPHTTEDGVVHFIVPDGANKVAHDPEAYEPTPDRPRGTTKLHDLDSFARRIDTLGTPKTVIYAEPDTRTLVAVINDDSAGDAGWRDHRLVFALRPTPQWEYWTKHEGLHDQQKFAEVIEDGLDDIAWPEPATMLDVSRHFTASIGSNFRQAARLRDGALQFVYEESIDAKGGENGEVIIPEEFKLRLSPYHGAPERDVSARLRYRVQSGHLSIGYALPLRDRMADEAFDEVVTAAVGRVKDHSILLGSAPSPTASRG